MSVLENQHFASLRGLVLIRFVGLHGSLPCSSFHCVLQRLFSICGLVYLFNVCVPVFSFLVFRFLAGFCTVFVFVE